MNESSEEVKEEMGKTVKLETTPMTNSQYSKLIHDTNRKTTQRNIRKPKCTDHADTNECSDMTEEIRQKIKWFNAKHTQEALESKSRKGYSLNEHKKALLYQIFLMENVK